VCVTGGEPLAQARSILLLKRLCDEGYKVSLETSGALDISSVDPRVSVVLDIKTPGSLELKRNLSDNLSHLKSTDQIKLVITSRADYEYARERVLNERLHEKAMVLLSPMTPGLSATDLAQWIIEDALPVRFQLQLHKVLWNDARGR
jgi:7-carboxy-7-deazaguanine synthase